MRIVIVVGLLSLAASEARAQFYGPYRQEFGFYRSTGPYSYTYVRGYYWQYPPPAYYVPVYVPYPVSPPIVINNIVQPAAPVARKVDLPPEFDAPPPPPKVIPKRRPAPEPKPDGRAEADRVADAGKRALSGGEYGRAAELFERGVRLMPEEASAYWLLSQAQVALGKYAKAVEAIRQGMARRADWPQARYSVREALIAADADELLAGLRQAVAAIPDDRGLRFLLAHQLWFDGRRDEARDLFAGLKDDLDAARFLPKR